jgi:hypothetical protein
MPYPITGFSLTPSTVVMSRMGTLCIELHQFGGELVGVDRIERALVFQLRTQQLDEFVIWIL